MSADRSEIRERLVDVFEDLRFPVSSRAEIERQFGPADAATRVESGDFSMSLQAIGNAVRGTDVADYPYEDAESLADAVVAALDRAGRL
jgi:hypothetical protein